MKSMPIVYQKQRNTALWRRPLAVTGKMIPVAGKTPSWAVSVRSRPAGVIQVKKIFGYYRLTVTPAHYFYLFQFPPPVLL